MITRDATNSFVYDQLFYPLIDESKKAHFRDCSFDHLGFVFNCTIHKLKYAYKQITR